MTDSCQSKEAGYGAASPTTCTGELAFAFVPLPTWPFSFLPQQYVAPLSVRPQVVSPPALSATNRRPPLTATGFVLQTPNAASHRSGPVLVPMPSSPNAFHPQQYAVPLAVRKKASAKIAESGVLIRRFSQSHYVWVVRTAAQCVLIGFSGR